MHFKLLFIYLWRSTRLGKLWGRDIRASLRSSKHSNGPNSSYKKDETQIGFLGWMYQSIGNQNSPLDFPSKHYIAFRSGEVKQRGLLYFRKYAVQPLHFFKRNPSIPPLNKKHPILILTRLTFSPRKRSFSQRFKTRKHIITRSPS